MNYKVVRQTYVYMHLSSFLYMDKQCNYCVLTVSICIHYTPSSLTTTSKKTILNICQSSPSLHSLGWESNL